MKDKILLALLPYWVPLIPPMGISCLKSSLQAQGYSVTTVDANVENRFQEVMDRYFNLLKEYVPPTKQGNIYNLGNEVLRHQMMAHLHARQTAPYRDLVKRLVYNIFYTPIDDHQVEKLQELLDMFFQRLREYVINLLEREKHQVLGLSAYTVTLPASLFAFQLAKEIDPTIKTVMGGGIFSGELDMNSPNFQYFLERTPYIDAIIVGEGESLFLDYLQGKLPSDRKVYTLADVGHQTLAMSEVLLPDYSDMDVRFYTTLASYTSRSCPFNCSFCSEKVLWGKYRKKTGRQIADELVQLSGKYKGQLFLMADSLLNPVVDDLSKTLIDEKLSLYWDGYLRADAAVCNRDNTFQWRQGGFYRARLGLESGSPQILEAMGKKITPTQIKQAVSALAYTGIKTTTYWVIGHPGETEKDFQATLDLITEMKDDIYEADCNPFIYFPSGQVSSDQWAKERKNRLLYPAEYREMMLVQTWVLDVPPSREETYQRVNRFTAHCRELGIPNPYTLRDIYHADERWKKLHPNAVPPLADFLEGKNSGRPTIHENMELEKMVSGQSIEEPEGDWNF